MTARFLVVSWSALRSAVHPAILASGSTDWQLFRFSCLLCPSATIVAPRKRQVQKDDLGITFDAPCSRIGGNPIITVALTDNIPTSGVPGAVSLYGHRAIIRNPTQSGSRDLRVDEGPAGKTCNLP